MVSFRRESDSIHTVLAISVVLVRVPNATSSVPSKVDFSTDWAQSNLYFGLKVQDFRFGTKENLGVQGLSKRRPCVINHLTCAPSGMYSVHLTKAPSGTALTSRVTSVCEGFMEVARLSPMASAWSTDMDSFLD